MFFVIDSNELDYVIYIKFFGVVIDNLFFFNVYIKEVCWKVNIKVLIFCCICKFIFLDVMIKLYKVFIFFYFEYVLLLFIGLSKGLFVKLELINVFVLRIFFNYFKLIVYEELLKIVNIKSLEY